MTALRQMIAPIQMGAEVGHRIVTVDGKILAEDGAIKVVGPDGDPCDCCDDGCAINPGPCWRIGDAPDLGAVGKCCTQYVAITTSESLKSFHPNLYNDCLDESKPWNETALYKWMYEDSDGLTGDLNYWGFKTGPVHNQPPVLAYVRDNKGQYVKCKFIVIGVPTVVGRDNPPCDGSFLEIKASKLQGINRAECTDGGFPEGTEFCFSDRKALCSGCGDAPVDLWQCQQYGGDFTEGESCEEDICGSCEDCNWWDDSQGFVCRNSNYTTATPPLETGLWYQYIYAYATDQEKQEPDWFPKAGCVYKQEWLDAGGFDQYEKWRFARISVKENYYDENPPWKQTQFQYDHRQYEQKYAYRLWVCVGNGKFKDATDDMLQNPDCLNDDPTVECLGWMLMPNGSLYECDEDPQPIEYWTDVAELPVPSPISDCGDVVNCCLEYLDCPQNAARSMNKSKGLGDMVSDALSSVGITKERVSKAVGGDCGCAKRQEKLNKIGQKIGIGRKRKEKG